MHETTKQKIMDSRAVSNKTLSFCVHKQCLESFQYLEI